MEYNAQKSRKRQRSQSIGSGVIPERKRGRKNQRVKHNSSSKRKSLNSRTGSSKQQKRDNTQTTPGKAGMKREPIKRDESYRDSMKILSERELDEIAQLEEAEVVSEIFKKLKAFQDLLDEEHQIKKPEVMNNVLDILNKAVVIVEKSKHSKDSPVLQDATRVIGEALNDKHKLFQMKLKMHLDCCTLDKLLQICSFFSKLLCIFPESDFPLPVSDLGRAIKQVDPTNESSKQVADMMVYYDKAKEKPASSKPKAQEWDNTEYKSIPVAPQWNEISCIKSLTRRRLRPNITTGCYEDWLHYFDIHFRLLREDFIAPLRKGVRDYLNGIRGRELSNIKIYTNVQLVNIKFSMAGVCCQINIGQRPRSSKRLIYGSLVCLSHDQFHENILFGTVDNCDGIRRGVVDIKFFDDEMSKNILQYTKKKTFEMVESYAYFEAYRPILQSLKESDRNSMPFTKYLIEADCSDVSKPQYLSGNPNTPYDLSHLIPNHDDVGQNDEGQEEMGQKDVGQHDLGQEDVDQVGLGQEDVDQDDLGQEDVDQYDLGKENVTLDDLGQEDVDQYGLGQEDVDQDDLGLEDVDQDDLGQEDVDLDDLGQEDVDQDDLGPEDVDQDDLGQEDVDQDDLGPEDVDQDDLGQEDVDQDDLGQKDVGQQYMGQKDIANKEKFSKIKNVCDLTLWPLNLDLDKSQIDALYNGLTQELSVIQGPPGTGKTYIGLKLVETLLKNDKLWNSEKIFKCKSPILVMCYTNHALDQFLEGILNCPVYKKANNTIRLLRIGSRTKSERLAELSIHKKRKTTHIPLHERREIGAAFKKMKSSQLICQKQWDKFKLSLETIIPLQRLKRFLDANHDYFFFHGKFNREEKLLNWLLPAMQMSKNVMSNQKLHSALTVNSCAASSEDTNFELDRKVLGIETEYNNTYCYELPKQHPPKWDTFESIIPDIKERQEFFFARKTIVQFMNYLSTVNPMSEEEAIEQFDLDSLPWQERVKLYKYWVMKYQEHYANQCFENFRDYNTLCTQWAELRQLTDRYVIETASIIGMTTTCAAKYKDILQRVKPKIIIVEEAAEVLESHIVSALSNGTQHLILIGDHKQLRPKPNEYDLEKNYDLGISLFERLIRNEHPHVTLNIQHRMRPEISQLIHPHIYDKLLNHSSVEEYPNIRGVSSNLFFIDHNEPESEDACDNSHSNDHEADFLVALCRYLRQQDYSSQQITVLVTYSGQLLKMRNKMRQDKMLADVRISTVDDFQGEENDIILLSLVRSNEQHNIGFLKEDNRVCVALSRARQGFYCIGNFQLLRNLSLTWDSIISDLESKGKIGRSLTLQCNNHPEVTFEAKSSSDFKNNFPDGGCGKQCGFRLPCGHVCENTCHSSDPKHTSYQCEKKCSKACDKGHPCTLECYEDCGSCMQIVTVKLSCGHEQSIKCSVDPSSVLCKAPCPKKCPARSHSCNKRCYEECGDCQTKIFQTMAECNHKVYLPCYIDSAHKNCPEPCSNILPCGHMCALTCGRDCKSEPCKKPVMKVLPCQHIIAIPCLYSETNETQCAKQCSKKLACGHACTKSCSEPCTEKCMEMVSKHYPCHHPKKDRCYRTSCERPCEKKLPCGHPCVNLCGEPCQDKCSVACGEVLTCGHECEGICHSCTSSGIHKLCQFKVNVKGYCGHQRTLTCAGLNDQGCTKSHYIICAHQEQLVYCNSSVPVNFMCRHRCSWRCRHFQCRKLCSEGCSRPPCNEPCLMKLRCGHTCPGLCGEPCLKLCYKCEKDKFKKQLKCSDDRNSAYYQLSCGHIFTVKYLDDYTLQSLRNRKQAVSGPLLCPSRSCGKPMSSSYRYGNAAKEFLEHMNEVKYQIRNDEQLYKEQLSGFLGKLTHLPLVNCRLSCGYDDDDDHDNDDDNEDDDDDDDDDDHDKGIPNNKVDRWYLAMLLKRLVNTSALASNSSCSIQTEVYIEIIKICELYTHAALSYTIVRNYEQKYYRWCLESQVYQAKQIYQASQLYNKTKCSSISKAEALLKCLDGKKIKVELTLDKFCKFSNALAKDFPQTVRNDFQAYVSEMSLNHPFLQKGLWWYCSAGNHYYCTPASINKIEKHHCPACNGKCINVDTCCKCYICMFFLYR